MLWKWSPSNPEIIMLLFTIGQTHDLTVQIETPQMPRGPVILLQCNQETNKPLGYRSMFYTMLGYISTNWKCTMKHAFYFSINVIL